ncbi:chemotaxis protein CheB [Motiliproteus sediminis]|uniref:chemotaxis protein CheB n=1 Tax=Motiliproteus sediminis TaxID=1468178 RepID=UPI001AF002D1|nr:chemotaxis protein CheB [Motiliproteus sediminis]
MSESSANTPAKPEQGLTTPTHYVAIGASAGGLDAIQSFFRNMIGDSGLAFIVIQHLSPDHKSLMKELLGKFTSMPVHVAEDGDKVEANHVYLIPPKKNLQIYHGQLIVTEQDRSRGDLNLPIDLFMSSLATDQSDKAIGIILSGTGSDGCRGIRSIKEALGMVIVQSPETAAFDGMPRNALATGLADYDLAPDEMPEQLLSYSQHPYGARSVALDAKLKQGSGLERIFSLLRDYSKVDFSHYKSSTVVRRLERRMAFNQLHRLSEYIHLLETNRQEIGKLYRELLIGVTSFFRDPMGYEELTSHLQELILEKSPGSELRLWSAGCSSGEEAYSLAILCFDIMEQQQHRLRLKIFATDIDQEAIHQAGQGRFSESIAADVPLHLLEKYFMQIEGGYQISRYVREAVVFARHNIFKDPPFTNVDLISCRNLLIYLEPVLQRTIIELFNYALQERGVLFLGPSESLGDAASLFEAISAKWKVFRSKGRAVQPGRLSRHSQMFVAGSSSQPSSAPLNYSNRSVVRDDERMLQRLLESLAPGRIHLLMVVNEEKELIHLVGESSDYIKLPQGRLTNQLTKLADPSLSIPFNTGLQKCFKSGKEVRFSNIRFEVASGKHRQINILFVPLAQKRGQEPLVAILIDPVQEERLGATEALEYDADHEAKERINDLEQELQLTRENLQATVEELETSNEELQASNEELLASNEELQSTNEELQSVNEELFTVNAEYESKITELTEAHNDMDNLLRISRISTIFLDENLDIRRFTTDAADLVALQTKDIGRPFRDLTHNLDIDLNRLIDEVVSNNQDRYTEARYDGRIFLVRVYPYHLSRGAVSGVVLSFTDITELKELQQKQLNTAQQLDDVQNFHKSILNSLKDAAITADEIGTIQFANQATETLLGYCPEELVGRNVRDLMPQPDRDRHDGYLQHYRESGEARIIGQGRRLSAQHKDGSLRDIWLEVTEGVFQEHRLFTAILRQTATKPGPIDT